MVNLLALARPVEGGPLTAALLAHLAASKFGWHLQVHRQTLTFRNGKK
jgi:hypothetical protein